MGERENLRRLSDLKHEIEGDGGYWRSDNLEEAVLEALRVDGPYGKPKAIDDTAVAIGKAWIEVDKAAAVIERIRKVALPQAWSGRHTSPPTTHSRPWNASCIGSL